MTRPSGPRWSSVASSGPMKQRSVTSNTDCSRLLAVSSGENSRKVPPPSGRGRRGIQVAHAAARGEGVLDPWPRPGLPRRHLVAGEVGERQLGRAAARRWRTASPTSAGRPRVRGRAAPGTSRPVVVEQLLGPVGAHPLLEHPQVLRVARRGRTSGTWWARLVPSTWTPSTTSGPVQPLGVRRTIAGHRCRTARPGRCRRGRRPGAPGSGRGRRASAASSAGKTCSRVVAGRR